MPTSTRSTMTVDGKTLARQAWGDSPTGISEATTGLQPGTREFFDRAYQWRSDVEQSWLPDVVPFHEWSGRKVLELGHGPGFDAFTIMKAGATYTGIDLAPENVERTRTHLGFHGLTPNVSEGDAEALLFADADFDVVYSNGVLHHTPDIAQAFREARRVLKPGGRFYVIVYHRHSLFYWFTLGLGRQVIRGGWRNQSLRERVREIEWNRIGVRPIVNVYSRGEVRRMLLDAGFSDLTIRVRKLTADDLPQLRFVRRWFRYIPRPIFEALSKRIGWYIIGEGCAR